VMINEIFAYRAVPLFNYSWSYNHFQ
jgi:hypothetical protein